MKVQLSFVKKGVVGVLDLVWKLIGTVAVNLDVVLFYLAGVLDDALYSKASLICFYGPLRECINFIFQRKIVFFKRSFVLRKHPSHVCGDTLFAEWKAGPMNADDQGVEIFNACFSCSAILDSGVIT